MASDVRRISVPFRITDISTAETLYIPVSANMEGKIVQVKTCLGGAITDSDVKVIVSKNATALGTITVAYTSSAAGDIDLLDVTSPTDGYIKEGDYIKIAGDGASSTAVAAIGVIDIIR